MEDKIENVIDWDGVITAYYLELIPIPKIIEKFKLPTKGSSITQLFPEYRHASITCEHCDVNLVSKYAAKSNYEHNMDGSLLLDIGGITPFESGEMRNNNIKINSQHEVYSTNEGYKIYSPLCPKCTHRPVINCRCKGCLNIGRFNKSIVQKKINESAVNVDIGSLGCEEIFSALCLIEYGYSKSEHKILINKLDENEIKIARNIGLIAPTKNAIRDSIKMLNTVEYMVTNKKTEYQINIETELVEKITGQLKRLAAQQTTIDEAIDDVVILWRTLALREVLPVLAYYCDIFDMPYIPGEEIMDSIKRSLYLHGLGMTASYIRLSVRDAQNFCKQQRWHGKGTAKLIHQCIYFYTYDEDVRGWDKIKPFSREYKNVLCEPDWVRVFARSFLEPNGIDYYNSPINIETDIGIGDVNKLSEDLINDQDVIEIKRGKPKNKLKANEYEN